MENYYQLNLYKGEPIKVTPAQKSVIEAATTSSNPPEFVRVGSDLVAVRNIAGIEATLQSVYAQHQLPGEVTKQQTPILPGNRVEAIWVKKRVTEHEYDKRYGNLPGYFRLPGDDIWVAFTRVLSDGLPLGLEEVTPSEFAYLESRTR